MRRAAKIDTVAPDLVQLIKASGAQWLPWPGGPIDGFVLANGWRIFAVDFKSKGGRLTDTQQRLLEEGWPIQILRSSAEVQAMLRRGGVFGGEF